MLIFFRILQITLLYAGGIFLCYSPFRNKLRLGIRRTSGVFFLLFCAVLSGYLGLLCFVSDIAAHLWLLASLPFSGLFFILSIKENPRKSAVILLLVGCYGAFLSGSAVLLAKVVFKSSLHYELIYTMAYLLVGGVTYCAVHQFIFERFLPVIHLVDGSDLRSSYFILLFYIIIQAVFFTFYDSLGQINDLSYFLVLISLNIPCYCVIMNLLRSLNSTLDTMRMKEEISTAEKLLELQKSQYASWVKQIEAVRRARHDLKHHITMIQSFLDKDDREGLQEHIRNFQHTLSETIPMMLCKHPEVNAILLHYYDRARKEKIRFELLANVSEDIEVNPQDLAVIFGNCLENAFEACARMEASAEKSVSLMAKPMGRGLAVIIDNTFDGKTVKENDIYLSSKRDHQAGVGMTSVKLVAERYSGIVSFKSEGNIFMTSIRLGAKKHTKKEETGNGF